MYKSALSNGNGDDKSELKEKREKLAKKSADRLAKAAGHVWGMRLLMEDVLDIEKNGAPTPEDFKPYVDKEVDKIISLMRPGDPTEVDGIIRKYIRNQFMDGAVNGALALSMIHFAAKEQA